MKTVRNQLKYPIEGIKIPSMGYFYRRELRTLGIQFFMQLQKKQQIDKKLKIN